MSREDGPRGGQWLAQGADVVAAACDRKRPTPAPPEIDHCSRSGALHLAARIRAYWFEQTGKDVICHIEPTGFGVVAVRSDLRSGLPR
jgi:hypothetical protein